jgi:hypothetical protein
MLNLASLNHEFQFFNNSETNHIILKIYLKMLVSWNKSVDDTMSDLIKILVISRCVEM